MQTTDFGIGKHKTGLLDVAVRMMETRPRYNKRVIRLSIALNRYSIGSPRWLEEIVHAIINTTTFGCLYQIVLENAELDWSQRTSIRAFSQETGKLLSMKACGFSVLLHSTREAFRITVDIPKYEVMLMDSLLRELIKKHPNISYEALNDLYIDHHAFHVWRYVRAYGAVHSKENKKRTERKRKRIAVAQIRA